MNSSGFFNSSRGDRRYAAEDWAAYFASFIGNGVFPNPSYGLQVMELDAMRVQVMPGRAWINGYFFNLERPEIFVLDNADGVAKRVDRIAARLDITARAVTLVLKKGVYGGDPEPPELTRTADVYELALADVYIGGGAVEITQADITDLRLDTGLCGIVHGVVDQADTTTIFNQYTAWLKTLQTSMTGDPIIDGYLHIRQTVDSEQGVHGLRYYNDRLEFFNGNFWEAVYRGGEPEPEPDISFLSSASVLNGVFGGGVFNASQTTVTKFGAAESGAKYGGGVCVGDGKVVAIPYGSEQPALIDANALTLTKFGAADTADGKYFGGVYAGNGMTVAIPYNASQPAMIDTNTMSITPFGASDGTAGKYRGGVYVGGGKVVAIPHNADRFAMIDTNDLSITPFGTANAAAAKYYGGIYIGGGRILAIPYTASMFAFVDINTLDVIPFGPEVTGGSQKYAGGVYIGSGRVVPIPYTTGDLSIVDMNTFTITKFGTQDSSSAKFSGGVYIGSGLVVAMAFYRATFQRIDTEALTNNANIGPSDSAASKYSGGVYAGNGKIVAIPYSGATQPALIDLGASFRPAQPLSEDALLSAWLNKL